MNAHKLSACVTWFCCVGLCKVNSVSSLFLLYVSDCADGHSEGADSPLWIPSAALNFLMYHKGR
ncbi:hypothetical protein JOQ06_005485, partial [Pogonophryne albipinna]